MRKLMLCAACVLMAGVALAQNPPNIAPPAPRVTGTLSGSAVSAALLLTGPHYNVTLDTTNLVGTVYSQKLLPGDTIWHGIWATPALTGGPLYLSWGFEEFEPNTQIELYCVCTSGTVSYRLSQ